MAESGYVKQAEIRTSLQKIEKVVQITLDVNGKGTTDINLDRAFLTTPKLMVSPPAGAAGTYAVGYLASMPKITISTDPAQVFTSYTGVVPGTFGVAETVAGLQSRVVEVILYGIEQP